MTTRTDNVMTILEPSVYRLFYTIHNTDVPVDYFPQPNGDVAVYGSAENIKHTLSEIKKTIIARKSAAKHADSGTLFFYSDCLAATDRATEHLHIVMKLKGIE